MTQLVWLLDVPPESRAPVEEEGRVDRRRERERERERWREK